MCSGQSEIGNEWTSKQLYVVGADAAGKLLATGGITLVAKEQTFGDTAFDSAVKRPRRTVKDVALAATWNAGTLRLKGRTMGLDKAEAARLLAPHAIKLP